MSLAAHLPVLQVAVPLLTAPLVCVLQPRGLAWAAALTASLCGFGMALMLATATQDGQLLSYALGGWLPPFGIELRVDAFSALLLLLITGASSLALLAARSGLDREVATERQPLFYGTWLLALSGLSGIAVTGDAFNVFVFMEISSLASYVLIAGGGERQALRASFKYLVMGTIGATFYLIGIGYIYMMTGTLNLDDMRVRLGEVDAMPPVLIAAGFITVGLALKAAVFPLHAWMPGAYRYAPHAVSVFLAACSTKVSLYVLMRLDFLVFAPRFGEQVPGLAGVLLPLALLGILGGSILAILERDLKRLLAYSSIAQLGYILVGAAIASVTSLSGAIVHMLGHALAKGGLFLALACLALGRSRLTVEGLAGAARRQPLTSAALLITGLSLIGVPGTAGFVGKWYLVRAALEMGALGIPLIAVVLLGSVLAVFYVWRLVEAAYFGEAGVAPQSPSPAYAATAALWLAAIANIYFGLQPHGPLRLAGAAAARLTGG